MPIDTSAALRHTPKQTRGQKKVEHILRSAEALFAEVGFENATTNAIASRAGVSIGSLYQFFASKEAILEAMAAHYLEQTRTVVEGSLTFDEQGDLHAFIMKMLELLVKQQEQRPYFLQCLGSSRPSASLATTIQAVGDSYAKKLEEVFMPITREDYLPTLGLRSRMIVSIAGSLLAYAVRSKGRSRSLATHEIALVLERYLEPTLNLKGAA